MNKLSPLLCLAFDGGGIRGLLQAILFLRTIESIPELVKKLKSISGTSIGSVCAAWIAAGLPPEELAAILEEEAENTFTRWYGLPRWRWIPWIFGMIRKPRYQSKGLENLLRRYFKKMRLKDLQIPIVVTAYSMRDKEHRWFTSFPGDPFREMPVVDALLCSTAAPGYFKPHMKHADGGLSENHPGWGQATQLKKHLGVSPDQLWQLSIGTGHVPGAIDGDEDMGLDEWLAGGNLLEATMGGNSNKSHQTCEIWLGDRYCRVQPNLPRAMALDDLSTIPDLKEIAQTEDLGHVIEWWQRFEKADKARMF